MRKLASIQKLLDIKSITGADFICAYKVQGWWVVDSVGKYRIDDAVIYCEIDSWIPTEIAPFLSKGKESKEYNNIKGERLKTIKLKGQLSQGLLLPIELISLPNLEIGQDVSKELNIVKYEPVLPACLSGQTKSLFPAFIQKTDQPRIQALQQEITESFNNKDAFEVTLKLDGSSCTVYHKDSEVGVCSRNLELKLDQEGNSFINIAKSTGLLQVLKSYGRNIAVQGELMGPGIQGNKEKLNAFELFIFDIFDIDSSEYFDVETRKNIIDDLYRLGYSGKVVPTLGVDFKLPSDDIDELLLLAKGASINCSVREGLVFKRNDGKFSFKIINNEFLLREK